MITLKIDQPYDENWPTVKDLTTADKIHFRPEAGGVVLIGTGDHGDPIEDADTLTDHVEHDHVTRIGALMARRMPAFADAQFTAGWTGPYDITPDWNPIVGPVTGLEGVFVAVGVSGHGFKLAPTIGESLAQCVLGLPLRVAIEAYSAHEKPMPAALRDSRRKQRTPRKTTSLPPGLSGGQYRPLKDDDVVRIHEAALSVLERTGVEIVESECRRILEQAGASVDAARDRVFIPRHMVEATLKTVNRDVVLYSKDGRFDLHLRDKRVHLGTGGAAVYILDLETGRARETKLRDLYDIGRLVETLDNIHFYLRPWASSSRAARTSFSNGLFPASLVSAPQAWGDGLVLLANLHVSAAVSTAPFIEFPFDPPSWTPERRDFILPKPTLAENGWVRLPDAPGLGVEIDWQTLESLRINVGTMA